MKLLLHVCCAPCSTHCIEALKEKYDITLFFYNPNIEPLTEFGTRLETAEEYASKLGLPIIVGDYSNTEWRRAIAEHEEEPEGGERCFICYEERLRETARWAKQKGYDLFCTTLTVSPYKNAEKVNEIGAKIGAEQGIKFLEADFKKQGGYMNSIKLSKENNLYRQHYCGCLFSK